MRKILCLAIEIKNRKSNPLIRKDLRIESQHKCSVVGLIAVGYPVGQT
jgi:hypothetical protein